MPFPSTHRLLRLMSAEIPCGIEPLRRVLDALLTGQHIRGMPLQWDDRYHTKQATGSVTLRSFRHGSLHFIPQRQPSPSWNLEPCVPDFRHGVMQCTAGNGLWRAPTHRSSKFVSANNSAGREPDNLEKSNILQRRGWMPRRCDSQGKFRQRRSRCHMHLLAVPDWQPQTTLC